MNSEKPEINGLAVLKDNHLLKFQLMEVNWEKAARSCTIRIKGTTADGSTYEGTITVSDVSWLECQSLKLGAWWDRNF